MANARTLSETNPARNLPLQHRLIGLYARSASMGLLPPGNDVRMKVGPRSLGLILDSMQRHALLQTARVDLAPLLVADATELDDRTAERMTTEVDRLVQVLEESPLPKAEWPLMRALLGDATLAALVGIGEASLRRYAAGQRHTPQATAERLHWLAMTVSDLAGGYNDYGIRRWFERPRSQLGGQSPREHLGDAWTPDTAPAQAVRQLAAALTGAQPLAA